jgi:L-fucose isomerase-like protein
MQKEIIKLGVVPTRRGLMFPEEAVLFKEKVLKWLKQKDVEVTDIEDINAEGILLLQEDVEKIVNKLKAADVDGVFFPHVNFGSEDLVGKVANALKKPVLIWGPRDDAPTPAGEIKRFTQVGIFATGKVLRHYGIPFTYLNNCRIGDKILDKGFDLFTSVCSVVRAFGKIKVLQVAPRPASFWSVIINEGELLEKFGIEVFPLTLSEIVSASKELREKKNPEFELALEQMQNAYGNIEVDEEALSKLAGLKAAIKNSADTLGCNAIAMQCWSALQDEMGIMPCSVYGMLFDQGLPATCETDIHGAISSIMLQEAADRTSPVFFADLTIRHPENDNAELLWHCGNAAYSLAYDEGLSRLENTAIFEHHCPGAGHFRLKDGDLTLCRFDGDHGNYHLFIGEAKTTEGPMVNGSYVWIQVNDWPKWERRLVTGPYVHHISGVHAKVAPVLYETCKYIEGLEADPIEPSVDEIEKYLTNFN